MINIPKNITNSVVHGYMTYDELAQYILANYNSLDVAKSLVELMVQVDVWANRQPILVTQEEFDVLTSLFKIKGQRTLEDGTVVKETRGRRPKAIEFDD